MTGCMSEQSLPLSGIGFFTSRQWKLDQIMFILIRINYLDCYIYFHKGYLSVVFCVCCIFAIL